MRPATHGLASAWHRPQAAVLRRTGGILLPLAALTLAAHGCTANVASRPGGEGGQGGTGTGNEASCQSVAGAYQLARSDAQLGYGYGDAPWMLLREAAGRCEAVVANDGFPGRAYQVTFTESSVELVPVGLAARGGHEGLTEHHLTDWSRILLHLSGSELGTTGVADIAVDMYEEDIGDTHEMTMDVSVQAAEPAALEGPIAVLPWRAASLMTTRPVTDLAESVSPPSGEWLVQNVTTDQAVGVIQAEMTFEGLWEDIRGRTLPITVDAGLADLAGLALALPNLTVEVRDVGPPVSAHELHDTTTLATWGPVEPYTRDDCATNGCVAVRGECGAFAGIAGQLDTDGMSEVVLAMRQASYEGQVDPPAFARAEVVGELGVIAPLVSSGEWPYDDVPVEWIYDVSGLRKVGFAIEASSYCHGWGGPVIVDRVFAR